MANVTKEKVATTTLRLTGTVDDLKTLATVMNSMGIEAQLVKKTEIVEPEKKKNTKAKATKGKATTKAKASDSNFDRELYTEVAEKLGVLGKHGVYRFARPTVYKAMEENNLTDKKIESYKAKLEKIATEKELTWFLGNDTEEVEIEDDDFEVAE